MLMAVAGIAAAQQPEPLDPEVARLVRAVAEAKTPEEAAKGLTKLFKGADRKKLERLKLVKEDGVAIRAAWAEIASGGFPRKGKQPELGAIQRVDTNAAARFLGFVEGRLAVHIPRWWEEGVRDSFDGGDGRLFAGEPTESDPPQLPAEKVIKVEKGVSKLRWGSDTLVLPPDVLESLRQPRIVSACVTRDTWLLVGCSIAQVSYPLICVDRRSGKTKWRSTVCGESVDAFTSGPSWHCVSVCCNGDRVFVFGLEGFTAYIEVFDANTGRNILRFASHYLAEGR